MFSVHRCQPNQCAPGQSHIYSICVVYWNQLVNRKPATEVGRRAGRCPMICCAIATPWAPLPPRQSVRAPDRSEVRSGLPKFIIPLHGTFRKASIRYLANSDDLIAGRQAGTVGVRVVSDECPVLGYECRVLNSGYRPSKLGMLRKVAD